MKMKGSDGICNRVRIFAYQVIEIYAFARFAFALDGIVFNTLFFYVR